MTGKQLARRRGHRIPQLLLAGLVVLGGATGCPLQPQSEPVPVEPPSPGVTQAPSPVRSASRAVTVYLVRENRLVAVQRAAPDDADQLTGALEALARGTDRAEQARRIRSAVPLGTPPPAWRGEADELMVDLPTTFEAISTFDQVLAVAQLVYTVTENSRAVRVHFVRQGHPVDVPDAAGRLLSRPVTRLDFRAIGPP